MEALAYALEHKGSEIYLFRETYDELEANIVKEWKEKVPQELYKYNESKHLATVVGGSRVFFRYVKNKSDADKYNGRSIDFIGVDELTRHEEEAIQIILSCVRSPKGFPPRFRGTCNPGGVGHVWVKKRYITPTIKGQKMYRDKDTRNVIAFIPATVYDNTVLMQNDAAYVQRLENLPPARRKAFLEGEWDAYEGQAFEEFSIDVHVCRPFQIPTHWRRWMANDPGYTDPFAWYWMAVDTQGTVYIYREYTRNYGDPKVTYSDQARKAIELMSYTDEFNQPAREQIGFIVTGKDAWNTHPLAEGGKTIIDHYHQGGLTGFIQCINDRKLRKATWHEYLKPFPGLGGRLTAKVQIFSTCKKLVETIPQQVEDEDDTEKVAETNYDHWYDACLTGDTVVNTVDGDIRINDLVGKTGMVHCYDETRQSNATAKFFDVRQTRSNADAYEVEFEDGRKIRATADHQILTKAGWKRLDELNLDDDIVDIAPCIFCSRACKAKHYRREKAKQNGKGESD